MIRIAIEIEEGLLEGLEQFLRTNGASQDIRGRVMAAGQDAFAPHLMGWHLGEAARKVNDFLEKQGAVPPIPRDRSRPWDEGRIQETLQLMLDHFNWQEGEILNWDLDGKPEEWAEAAARHPRVFGLKRVVKDDPRMLVTYTVEVEAGQAPELQEFMKERGLPFDMRADVTAVMGGQAGDRTLRGQDAQGAVSQINRRVRSGKLGREVPGPISRMSIDHIQACLDFALHNYDWQDGRIRRALFPETPERWAAMVEDNPLVFGVPER